MGNGKNGQSVETPLSPETVAMNRCRALALELTKQADEKRDSGDEATGRLWREMAANALDAIEASLPAGKLTPDGAVDFMTHFVYGAFMEARNVGAP